VVRRGRSRRRRLPQQHLQLEWPPRSGRLQEFPEVDRAAWFPVAEARTKLVKGQLPYLDRLLSLTER
jgi:predicted NUDIX family NTP pyrophosphohydrolase